MNQDHSLKVGEPFKMDTPKDKIMFGPFEQYSLHSFLYKLSRRCAMAHNQHKRVELPEEDARFLCHLLLKEGYFDNVCCAVCAIQILESRIMRQIREQIDVVSNLRDYYSKPENSMYYKFCSGHRDKNLNYAPLPPRPITPHAVVAPRLVQPQPMFVSGETRNYFHYAFPPPSQLAYFPEQVAMPFSRFSPPPQYPFDTYIGIPWNVDPNYFMINYNDWVSHFNFFYGTERHKRMSYTNNFVYQSVDDRKILGRQSV